VRSAKNRLFCNLESQVRGLGSAFVSTCFQLGLNG
jgi:hypothetical protein